MKPTQGVVQVFCRESNSYRYPTCVKFYFHLVVLLQYPCQEGRTQTVSDAVCLWRCSHVTDHELAFP